MGRIERASWGGDREEERQGKREAERERERETGRERVVDAFFTHINQ